MGKALETAWWVFFVAFVAYAAVRFLWDRRPRPKPKPAPKPTHLRLVPKDDESEEDAEIARMQARGQVWRPDPEKLKRLKLDDE